MKMEIQLIQMKKGDKETGSLQSRWSTTAMMTRNQMTSEEETKITSLARCMETEEINRQIESLYLERKMESDRAEDLCSGKTI
jgi:hypothetical protein